MQTSGTRDPTISPTLDLLMSAGSSDACATTFGHDLADDPVSGIDPEVAETLRAG